MAGCRFAVDFVIVEVIAGYAFKNSFAGILDSSGSCAGRSFINTLVKIMTESRSEEVSVEYTAAFAGKYCVTAFGAGCGNNGLCIIMVGKLGNNFFFLIAAKFADSDFQAFAVIFVAGRFFCNGPIAPTV